VSIAHEEEVSVVGSDEAACGGLVTDETWFGRGRRDATQVVNVWCAHDDCGDGTLRKDK